MPRPFSARLRALRPRLTRRRIIAGAVVLALLVGAVAWAAWPTSPPYRTEDQRITVRSGPSGNEPVDLDTRLYLPDGATAGAPVPAVLLAHGFGGTKETRRGRRARTSPALGYAVLTWTARGLRAQRRRRSTWTAPTTRYATRSGCWTGSPPGRRSAPTPPATRGSAWSAARTAAALALLLAGAGPAGRRDRPDDHLERPGPVVPARGRPAAPRTNGVFKKQWAGLFFGGGSGGRDRPRRATRRRGAGGPAATARACRRASSRATRRAAGSPPTSAPPTCASRPPAGPTPAAVALLRRSSPAAVLDQIKAPTLLDPGRGRHALPALRGGRQRPRHRRDRHAGAGRLVHRRARRRRRARSPTRTGSSSSPRSGSTTTSRATGDAPGDSFTYSRITGFNALDRGAGHHRVLRAPTYPGLGGTGRRPTVDRRRPAAADRQPAERQPGRHLVRCRSPAGCRRFVNGVVADLPGQHARFDSAPLAQAVDVVGAPTVPIRAASPTGEAVLFVKLYDVDPDGAATPVRRPGRAGPADRPAGRHRATRSRSRVTLPAIVHRIEAGHRLRITVATSDQAFATPVAARPSTPSGSPATPRRSRCRPCPASRSPAPTVIWRYVLAGAGRADRARAASWSCWSRAPAAPRADRTAVDREYADTPLVVRGLRKEYGDGFVAVSEVDFTVRARTGGRPARPERRRQDHHAAGADGPDPGRPPARCSSSGTGWRPARRCCPGSARWSRGPGFLPHLTGLENLRAVLAGHRPAGGGRALRRGAGDRRPRRRDPPQGQARTATA